MDIEVHCAVIEYGNEKAKPAHYLIQLTDLEDLDDKRQEWFPERQGVVTNPTSARVIGFFNIYYEMHCGNATFNYHDEFSKYFKVDGAMLEDSLIISLIWVLKNFYQKKKRNIYINYLKNEIQSILKLMKTLMMDLKTMLEMKACRILRMTSLVRIKSL